MTMNHLDQIVPFVVQFNIHHLIGVAALLAVPKGYIMLVACVDECSHSRESTLV